MNQTADTAQSLRITVVEDNESLCAVTVELLRQHGHYAVGVSSAEALSDEALDPLIDVLMVDLNLPGEDGVSLLGRYREACPHLTIVVVSSRDQVADRLACYRAGADAFVSKPSHPDELLAVINAVIRRRVTPSPASSAAAINSPATLNQRALTLHGPAGEVAIGERPALMLSALALAPGNRLENWQLIEAMREDPDAYTKAALEVRMVRLRQSFKAVGFDGVILRALRTTGYQLCVPVKVV